VSRKKIMPGDLVRLNPKKWVIDPEWEDHCLFLGMESTDRIYLQWGYPLVGVPNCLVLHMGTIIPAEFEELYPIEEAR
jgi:hypothetical protein